MAGGLVFFPSVVVAAEATIRGVGRTARAQIEDMNTWLQDHCPFQEGELLLANVFNKGDPSKPNKNIVKISLQ